MWNARLDEAEVETKIAGRNISNLRYANETTLIAESKEEPKSLLIMLKKKKKEWKSWFETQNSKIKDHGIWSHHIMANR